MFRTRADSDASSTLSKRVFTAGTATLPRGTAGDLGGDDGSPPPPALLPPMLPALRHRSPPTMMMLPRFENCIFSGAGSRSSRLPVGICIVIGRNPPPCALLGPAPVAVAGRVRDRPPSASPATMERPPPVVGGDAGAGGERLAGSEVWTTIDGVGCREVAVLAGAAAASPALEGGGPVGVLGAATACCCAWDGSGEVEGRSGGSWGVVGVSVCAVGVAELSAAGDDIV